MGCGMRWPTHGATDVSVSGGRPFWETKYVTSVGLGVAEMARCLDYYRRLAAVYVAVKYREVRKFLAGAFFVSFGTLSYLWATDTSIPLVLPYRGTIAVETPDVSGERAIVHFVLFLLCFYFGFFSKPKANIART